MKCLYCKTPNAPLKCPDCKEVAFCDVKCRSESRLGHAKFCQETQACLMAVPQIEHEFVAKVSAELLLEDDMSRLITEQKPTATLRVLQVIFKDAHAVLRYARSKEEDGDIADVLVMGIAKAQKEFPNMEVLKGQPKDSKDIFLVVTSHLPFNGVTKRVLTHTCTRFASKALQLDAPAPAAP